MWEMDLFAWNKEISFHVLCGKFIISTANLVGEIAVLVIYPCIPFS